MRRKGAFPLLPKIEVFTLKPVVIRHVLCQDFTLHQFRSYYGPHMVMANKDWPLITKFWMTDLSHLKSMLQDLYSDQGSEPRDPASMLRSFLILLMTNPEKGITEWVPFINLALIRRELWKGGLLLHIGFFLIPILFL